MRTLRSLVLGALVTGVIPFGAGISGCADQEEIDQEGVYTAPPGFSQQQTKQAVMGPGVFYRDQSRRIVSSTVYRRLAKRDAEKADLDAKSEDPRDDFHLEAVFGHSYNEGMTIATSRQPRAFLKVTPKGAQGATGRVRSDGAMVAFEGAYRNVTSAFSGRQTKVEEFLSIPSEADIPTLAYELTPGPEFGNFVVDEGSLWAFAKDGNGLFVIAPPVADDAAGKRVTGSWRLEQAGEGYTLTASIELRGLQFPVLLDPSFEVPQWWISNSPSPPTARAGAAGSYDASRKCSVIFGGATGAFGLLQDTYARCSADQKWSGAIAAASPPTAKAYAAMGQVGASGSLAMFGGFTASGATDEFHVLTLAAGCTSSSAGCTGSWGAVTKSGNWPPARYMHGAANDGSNLIIWGGIGASGAGLTDTWKWNGSSWTQVCDNCFGAPKGLYGFAPASTVTAGGARTIYSVGGYNDPSSASGQFTNNIFQFTGSGWSSVSTSNAIIPVSELGAISGSLTEPTPRYMHWAFGTQDNNLLIGSGLQTAANGSETYYTDNWLWVSSSSQWLHLPHPTTSVSNSGPGSRESATAIFDETNRNSLLFGGLDSGQSAQQNSKIYKGQARTVTVTQSCPDADLDTLCDNGDYTLTATFNGVAGSECNRFQGLFVKLNGLSGQWETEGAAVTGVLNASPCTITKTYSALDVSTYVDLGVRVRDTRMYSAALGVCAATAGEISTGGSRPGCLLTGGSNYQGSSSCAGLVDPSIPGLETIDCIAY